MSEPDPAPTARWDGASVAVRAAHRTLRLLGRLHLPLWRNTCLYRSVAECLVLRAHGVPCRLRIGVASTPSNRALDAHAWVERVDAPDTRAASPALAVLE